MLRFCFSLYVLVAAVFALTASGRIGLSDGFAMLHVSESIVNERSLSSEPCDPQLQGRLNHCVLGVNGRHYAGFGLVPSFLAVPAVLLARGASALLHFDAAAVVKVSVSLFTALLAPLVCVVLALWILKLGYSRRTAALGACILAFASPFWHFSVKGFYSEPYFTLALVLAAYFLSCPEMPAAAGLSGLALGIACGCRINGVILFPAFIFSLYFHSRHSRDSGQRGSMLTQFIRQSALFSAGFSVCIGLIAVANYARFGSPFKTGYQVAYPSASAILSTPLFKGMYELLFNGEIGLLVFAPWVLLALYCFPAFVREHLPESALCGTVFLINFLFFASFDSWHAGWVAGPRFLTPVLPFFVVAMAPALETLLRGGSELWTTRRWVLFRRAAILLLTIGAVIQCLGALYPEERYYNLFLTYYDHVRPMPWWAGSIPLASIDFLPRMASPGSLPVRRLASTDVEHLVADEESQGRGAMNTAGTEDDFLRSARNPENMLLPNMMVFKFRPMGLPASAAYGYAILTILLGFAGALGVRKYSMPEPSP